jgi:hypothetical protein
VVFYDDDDKEIDFTRIYSPVFPEKVPRKLIEAGYELIGVSLTIDRNGSWLNFVLWPENQPVV